MKEISIQYISPPDEDQSHVRTYTVKSNVTALNLSSESMIEVDLTPIKNLPRLETLSLQSNHLTDIDLSPLADCKYLKYLFLHDNQLEDIDLTPLMKCSKLETLNLNRNRLTNINFDAFSKHSAIRSIALIDNKLTSIDLSPLKGSNIGSLRLDDNNIETPDFSPLWKCQNLTELTLANNNISEIDLDSLPRSLTTLWLYMNNLQSIDLEPLRYLVKLRVLRLENNSMSDVDLTPLVNCKLLSQLNLTKNKMKLLDISPLFSCLSLTTLEVDQNVSLTALPEYQSIRTIPPALSKLRSEIQWVSGEDFPIASGRRLLNSKKFSKIGAKDLYVKLVREINDTYRHGSCTGTMMLFRKLLEGLFYEIILSEFDKGDAALEEFYDKDQGRIKNFSKLIDFFIDHRETFDVRLGITRRDMTSFVEQVKKVKNKLNTYTHSLFHSADEKDVDDILDDFNYIVDALLTIYKRRE